MRLARRANRGSVWTAVLRVCLLPIVLLTALSPSGGAQSPQPAQKESVPVAPRLKEAGELAKQGRHEESIELLQKIVAEDPAVAGAWTLLAAEYLQTNDFAAAVEAGSRATDLAPKDVEAWMMLARAFERQEKFAESSKAARKALELRPDHLPALVLRALTANTPGDALAAAQKAVKAAPKAADAHFALGRAKLRLKQGRGAVDAFKKAAELDPARAEIQLFLAKACLLARELKAATAAARRATELAPQDIAAWRALGEACSQAGQFADAQAALEKAIELDPSDGNLQLQTGAILLRSAGRDWSAPAVAQAIGHFQKAVEVMPDLLPAWEALHVCQSKLQQREAASKSARKIMLLDGKLPEPEAIAAPADFPSTAAAADFDELLERARVLRQQRKMLEAAALLVQAQRLRPNDTVFLVNILDPLRDAGWKAQAIEIARGVAARFPQDPIAHFALGMALFNDRQFEAAAPELARARDLAPKRSENWFGYGICLGFLHRWTEAIDTFTHGIRLAPHDRQMWKGLSSCYNDRRLQEGETHFRELLAEMPKAASGWYYLGGIYFKTGEDQKALKTLQYAAELAPRDAEIWAAIGTTYLKLNDPAKAKDALETAVKCPNPDAETWNNLGWARGVLGDKRGAIDGYDIALQLDPRHSRALVNLMRALVREGWPQKARPYWERLRAIDPALAENLKSEFGF